MPPIHPTPIKSNHLEHDPVHPLESNHRVESANEVTLAPPHFQSVNNSKVSELDAWCAKAMVHTTDLFSVPKLNDLLGVSNRTTSGSTHCPFEVTADLAIQFLSRGGKYSRPFITIGSFAAILFDHHIVHTFDEILHRGVQCAAIGIECFHKASLVHDDIEDGDAYRYGVPSMHQQYGIATAINVGDYLIGLGYRMISRAAESIDAKKATDILGAFSLAHLRLTEGQGAELHWRDASDKALSVDQAIRIYELKTSPAFEAALYAGIHLAMDSNEMDPMIHEFAKTLGIGYQILNDLHDWQYDRSNKIVEAGDVLGGRPTILLALALESLNEPDRKLLLNALTDHSDDDTSKQSYDRVEQVRRLYVQSRVFERAQALVQSFREQSIALTRSVASKRLGQFLEYLVSSSLHDTTDIPMTARQFHTHPT